MKLVVVESPAKAKTINKYLGKDYVVEASYGHVCQLPSKTGSVVPDNDFEMKYEVSEKSVSHIKKLSNLAKTADEIILATDPDREGEAISWHVVRVLQEKKSIKKGAKISRVAFNEITKKAVQEAIDNPREIDQDLVDAQQARSALDYLVGFNISPILWKKLPGAKSAGRVQSVALRLICERENDIEKFITEEYWDIHVSLKALNGKIFLAKLSQINGQKLDKFSLPNEKIVLETLSKLEKHESFFIKNIDKKIQKRTPPPPFTTSTLQQEASRKLGFTAKKTMQLAQKLYEGVDIGSEIVGLITYMRTDGVYLSADAISAARDLIQKDYGKNYLPSSPRQFKAKSKNAQEAHEAIRPTNISILPDNLSEILEKDMLKLYELIWKRTLASQMENAELETVSVDIADVKAEFGLRASGSIVRFDGFYKLYREGKDDEDDEDSEKILPPLSNDDEVQRTKIDPKQHFTEPPPRYNEASLVKKLEELGIGRPSTYATIISVIQDREYVKLEKKRFIPEERGRIVTAFLTKFFNKYVQYDFTANLEEDLDKIAEGQIKWKILLKEFWTGFHENVNSTSEIKIADVIESLDKILEDHLFPKKGDNDPRQCPSCSDGRLGLRLSKFGAFISCSNYPTCEYRSNIQSDETNGDNIEQNFQEKPSDKILGQVNEKNILLKKGPYGPYVEIEEQDKKVKPKRASIPSFLNAETIDLETAKKLLSLPNILGKNPEGDEISVAIGKYGPYVKCGNKFTSIPKSEDPLALDLKRALEIIEEGAKITKKKKE
jgi:DNA topoisomerase-1